MSAPSPSSRHRRLCPWVHGALFSLLLLLVAAPPTAAQRTDLPVAQDPLVRMPGTQPGQVTLEGPRRCLNCHSGFDPVSEPGTPWQGSMMAHAARDFLFWASLTVAAQDSIWALGRPNATDLCLRCHLPEGWAEGRSDPTNGAEMTGSDFDGVHCETCHRTFDPFFETTFRGDREGSDWSGYWDETDAGEPSSSSAADATYAADLTASHTVPLFNGEPFYNGTNLPASPTYTENGGGQYFLAPGDAKRGPFADAQATHPILYSRYHKSKYFCSACHDVSNPALANLAFEGTAPGDGSTVLPSEELAAFSYFHVERTFSEFLLSAYGRPGGAPGEGAFAPEDFATSLPDNRIARCQDCHLPDVAGKACDKTAGILRPTESIEHPGSGVPRHDLTGGNVWVSRILASAVPGSPNHDATNDALLHQGAPVLTLDLDAGEGVEPAALLAGADRALANLTRAARIEGLTYDPETGALVLRIHNHTGHKLISGYPEGRRMFLQLTLLAGGSAIFEVNPYDAGAGTLRGLPDSPASPPLLPDEAHVDSLVYEMHTSSTLTGEAKTFHFVLADGRAKDNRIPPKGFRIAEAAGRLTVPKVAGADAPGLYSAEEYEGGYDEVELTLPTGAERVEARLYYQTTSREYVEFLRDEIQGTADTLTSPTPSGLSEAYIAQTDPFFEALRVWGDTVWQLWEHNRNVPGAAPILMTEASYDVPPSGACTSDLVLTAVTVDAAQTFTACDVLTAGPDFRVIASGDLTFRAGARIVLRDGFSVAAGARFRAVIDPALLP